MGSVRIDRLDHLVLTVADIDATVEFYTRVLGMKAVTFGTPSPSGMKAVTFDTGAPDRGQHLPLTPARARGPSRATPNRLLPSCGRGGLPS